MRNLILKPGLCFAWFMMAMTASRKIYIFNLLTKHVFLYF
jgi:hypothetical protein